MDHFDPKDFSLADSAIVDSMGLALMAVDSDCRILRFNEPAEQLTGYTGTHILGRPCPEIFHASLCNASCPVQEVMRIGGTYRFGTVVLQTKDKRPLTVEITASALVDSDGKTVGAVGILRDVTVQPGDLRLYGRKVFTSRTPAMRRIFESLPKFSGSDAPLLIVGGRGSGRSALAETVHQLSLPLGSENSVPFVTVSCANLDPSDELELFGPKGLLARAQGGTLLIEEVCRAPQKVQRQLLAWLEENGTRVRLICTASKDLQSAVEREEFRQDLYYRLNVLHVAMPDLSQRTEDLPLLVQELIEELNVQHKRNVDGLTAGAMRKLVRASWPGNVRQLKEVINEAYVNCRTRLIRAADIPTTDAINGNTKTAAEIGKIRRALNQAQGNVTLAAHALGMHRTTLWRKLRRFEIKTD